MAEEKAVNIEDETKKSETEDTTDIPKHVHETRAGNNAPSVNMHFDDYADGTIIMHDVQVPKNASHVNTYYCTLQWNAGQEGGGYCGIQDTYSGHDSIFSLWDPRATHQAIRPVQLGHGTSSLKFGGEGTGLKTINYGYGWGDERWYTMVARVWNYGSHTHFGMWIHDQSSRRWFHHATMDYPVPNVVFKGSTNCFIEDFANSGQYSRSVYYKNGYKYTTSNQWVPFKSGTYSVGSSGSHSNAYDVRVAGSSFWLATGGSVTPTVGKHGTVHAGAMSSSPNVPQINFSLTSGTHNHASWNVPESSTPQFHYEVKIDGQTVSYGWSTEVRSVNYNHPGGRNLEIILEDILGRRTSHSRSI